MSMKNIIIGSAEREQRDVQTKIDIIRKSIDKYNRNLNYPHFNEESLIKIRENLDREELNLQKLKDKYPEHFI
jgi:uncharacterized membrane-anchored protein YhcB (DUF1043 family)